MTCQHCDEMAERIAWLESELGLQREADDDNHLRRKLHEVIGPLRCGSGGATRVMLALYAAKGRAVSRLALMEASPPLAGSREDDRDSKIIDVWICHARKLLGRDGIENVRGFGFRLTDAGVLAVRAILEPAQSRAA